VLATRFGVHAIDAVHAGVFGRMVALRADRIELVELDKALTSSKTVTEELYQEAAAFFG
jgi:6-phosphofructokinase 1